MAVFGGSCFDPFMVAHAALARCTSVFEDVASKLEMKRWFAKDGFVARSHPFPREEPEAITFHVFKPSWLNADTRGIHFESYLPVREGATDSYVTLHILHEPIIPGTKLKRAAVAVPFVDAVEAKVRTWEGYTVRVGKYGVQPFAKKISARDPRFVDIVVEEMERLCRELGPTMDRTLANVLGRRR